MRMFEKKGEIIFQFLPATTYDISRQNESNILFILQVDIVFYSFYNCFQWMEWSSLAVREKEAAVY